MQTRNHTCHTRPHLWIPEPNIRWSLLPTTTGQLVLVKEFSVTEEQEMPEEVQKKTKNETRRGSKPLVEKRRRARINHSLAELQKLVSTSPKKGYKQSRIEKADILEMTVRYVQGIQSEKCVSTVSVYDRFRDGYLECLSEASRYLTSTLDSRVHERLRDHLLEKLVVARAEIDRKNELEEQDEESSIYLDNDSRSSFKVSTTTPSPSTSPSPSQMTTTSRTNIVVTETTISPDGLPVACTESLAGVRVIPSRLPSGQLAFVVPTEEYLQYEGQCCASVSKSTPTPSRKRCSSMMASSVGSYNTSSLSPSYLSRDGEGGNPGILYQEAMCPSGGKNARQSTYRNMWRPW